MTPDPTHDFSSYVTITNSLSVPIKLVEATIAGRGAWSQPGPPDVINAGDCVTFSINESSNDGSSGVVSYSVADTDQNGGIFKFKFGCPRKDNNFATAEFDATADSCNANYALPFTAYAGDDSGQAQFCSCPNRGHPLNAYYTIAYRILSIGCINATPVLDVNGTLVSASDPIWEYGPKSYSDGKGGSTNPAVFPFSPRDGAPGQLSVHMTNDATTIHGFQLYARNAGGDLVLQSSRLQEITSSTVVLTVNAVQGSNGEVMSLVEAVTWDFGNPKNPITQTTPLEVYWLFDKPLSMWTNGVWVQALRDIFAVLPATDTNSMDACVADIVKNCFSGFENGKYKKKYALGQNYLGYPGNVSGPAFLLYNYFNNEPNPVTKGTTVDCVDQRSLVSVMLGAVGIPSGMYSLTINPSTSLADLVPVSTGSNTQVTLLPGVSVYPGTQYPGNIEWGGHDLVGYKNSEGLNVPLDATLGPAVGNQTVDQYLETNFGGSEDTQVTLDGGSDPAPCNLTQVICTLYS